MSEEKKMEEFLEKLKLGDYIQNFKDEQIIFSDFEDMEESDVIELIAKKVHRRRFMKNVKKMKEKNPTESKNSAGEEVSKKTIEMLVKWGKVVEKVYEVPVDFSNERLIGMLLLAFLKCEVKLQGESKVLAKEVKNFTLKDWCEKKGEDLGNVVRAVLHVKGENIGGSTEKNEELLSLEKELEELREALELEKTQKEEAVLNLKKEVEKIENNYRELEKKSKLEQEKKSSEEINLLKFEVKKLRKENKKLKEGKFGTKEKDKPRTTMSNSEVSTIRPDPKTFKFEGNKKYDEGVHFKFSNNNKRVTFNKAPCCLTTTAVFEKGKKYYFQVTANVVSTVCWGGMGIGLLKGGKSAVVDNCIGCHQKGWCCDMGELRYIVSKNDLSGNKEYGPNWKKGKYVIGVFVDFTGSYKGKVKFIINGKDWGIAFDDVEPPVSPAFSMYLPGEYFEIEEDYEIPSQGQ